MPDDRPTYWFPAKRYGWGWGVPRTWQGWTVIVVYVVVVTFAAAAAPDGLWAPLVVVAATVVLLLIGLKKGEPTKWRWGGDKGS